MKFALSMTGASPIGLDLGSACAKACQLRRGRSGRPEVAALLKLPRAPGESDASVIARLGESLPRQGFVGSRLVIAAPLESQLLGMFDVPPASSGAPLDTIIRAELARSSKRSPQSFELAWWELPSSERANEGSAVIAVGLAHEHANAILDTIEGTGYSVEAIDVPASALARGCRAALLAEPAINAVLDLGWLRPLLVLMRGRRIVYQRELPECGLAKFHVRLRERLRLDDEAAAVLGTRLCLGETPTMDPEVHLQLDLVLAEHASRLARELELSLRYAQHRYPGASATRVILTGGGGGQPNLAGELRASLGCEVIAPRLSELSPMGVAFAQATGVGDFTLALGLASHREDRAVNDGGLRGHGPHRTQGAAA